MCGANGPGSNAYHEMGFLDNPFLARAGDPDSDTLPDRLEAHAAASRLLREVDRLACMETSAPLWVTRSPRVPRYHALCAMAETFSSLNENECLRVLPLHISLSEMRKGRIRCVLSSLAERISGPTIDLTLAAYFRDVLLEPDAALPEFEGLADVDVEALIAGLDGDPASTMESLFGPCVQDRGGLNHLEEMSKLSAMRQRSLEVDPDESNSPSEGDEGLALTDGSASSEEMETADDVTEPGVPIEDGSPLDPVVSYLIAHAKAHLSPVIARAIRTYRTDGAAVAGEELKITKAPKKTLAALVALACHRYRKIMVIYDEIDSWSKVPRDAQSKILASMAELRWELKDHAIVAMFSKEGAAPELREQFPAASPLGLDMPGIEESGAGPLTWSMTRIAGWVDACLLEGSDQGTAGQLLEALEPLVAETGESMERYAVLACAAFEAAVARGARAIGQQDLDVAIESGG